MNITVFDNITKNQETLAKNLVYSTIKIDKENQVIEIFHSTLIKFKYWYTYSEAINATINELKKSQKIKERPLN